MTDSAPPELTPRAVVLAIVLAVILAAANAYLGLFAGMTIASAIPAASYYMRTHARLETGDARYAWVNRTLFVGSGARERSRVRVSLYAIR